MVISAKQFCAETGWPLKTIRRMCRTGQLEHWQRGRVYLLAQVSDLPRQRKCRITALPDAGFDGYSSRAERMKALLLGKKK